MIKSTGYQSIEPTEILNLEYDDTIYLHGLCDAHYGALDHHSKRLNEFINKVKYNPKARWFSNGDLIEFIPSNYKISQRGQVSNCEDQILEICDILKPIADKCIFIRGGNHEARALNVMGLDVTTLIAANLGVPHYRMPGYTGIKIKSKQWYMASGHGRSAAKNGNLELYKIKEIYSEADVFYLGHDHKLYAEPMPTLIPVGNEEQIRHRWFVRGGSFLKYADYVRYAFYSVGKTGWVEMVFSEDEINCIVH